MNAQIFDDAVLIERIRLGDHGALDALFHKYRSKAFNHALKMTKQIEEADDVVAESFIRAYRGIGRFQQNASFTTWMFKILRNCFLDIRKRRQPSVVCSLDASMETDEGVVFRQAVDPSMSAFDASAKAEYGRQVRSFLEKLPDVQGELLLMYYEEELTYSEIATRLATPTGTVKSRLYRAKANLKNLIEGNMTGTLNWR